MNIRIKLIVFFIVSICTSVLFYLKFEQSITNQGLLNFIGMATIIVVAVCHGIAFLIRSLLIRRHYRYAGISPDSKAWAPAVPITDNVLFLNIKRSFNKVAALSFILATVLAAIAFISLRILQNIPKEEFEPHLMQYWTLLASYALAMIMSFFTFHFYLMSMLLEYKSNVKAIFVSFVSFIVVFVCAVNF